MFLQTLGGLSLDSSDFSRPKPLLLLAYLVVEGAKDKRHLYELFWPEASDPANSLRSVGKLLRKLSPDVLGGDERMTTTSVQSDISALQTAISSQDAEKVLELYQGAFLQGFSLPDWGAELEEWVYTTREFVAGRVRTVFIHKAETAASRGDFDLARDWAEKACSITPRELSPEDLERLYPLLLASTSSLIPEVKRQAAEYGLTFSLSVLEARQKYFLPTVTGEPEFKSIPNNLPRTKTSFVGRDPELVDIAQLLPQSDVRLITLLGPGGIGKTRLALQLASHQLQESNFLAGVYFVALETLEDTSQIPVVIAQELNLRGKENPLTLVKAGIGSKPMLLVLDNFEHLMAGALLVSELLEACPNLKVVVTSRERLNLEEEFVLRIEGLPLPKPTLLLAEAEYNDALKLFVQRAKRSRLDFQLTQENLPSVLELCNLLEGSPLGIELATVWLRSLSPAELLIELTHSVTLLESPSRNLAERHQSLRVTFEYSWNLLTDKEKTALAKLTVFVGGFTREAASQVCDATIPILTSLLDKSLLKFSPEGRYDRHFLLYQFAHEKLLSDPILLAEMRQKHLDFFLSFAEAASTRLRGTELERAAADLQGEQDNLRATMAFAAASTQAEASLRLAVALSPFWELKGFLSEGRQVLKNVLDLDVATYPLLRAKALSWAGMFSLQHTPEAASVLFQDSLALAQMHNEKHTMARALRGLGLVAYVQGQFEEGLAPFEASLALLRNLDDPTLLIHTLLDSTTVLIPLEKVPKARQLAEEALHVYLSHGGHHRDAYLHVLNVLGITAQLLGDYKAAQQNYQEGLNIANSLGLIEQQAVFTENLADLAEWQDDLSSAQSYHRAALAILVRLENHFTTLWALINCARVEQRLGNFVAVLKLTGTIETHLEELNIRFPDYQMNVLSEVAEVATRTLGEHKAQELRLEGQKMSLHQTLELLKQEVAPAFP